MKKMRMNKTGRTSPMKGEVKRPKALKGMLKQTEGDTPREAMSTGKQAGMLKGGSRSSKAREKRLEKVPM